MRGLDQQSPALRGYLPRTQTLNRHIGGASNQELQAQLERQSLLSQRSAPNAVLSHLAAQAPFPGATMQGAGFRKSRNWWASASRLVV